MTISPSDPRVWKKINSDLQKADALEAQGNVEGMIEKRMIVALMALLTNKSELATEQMNIAIKSFEKLKVMSSVQGFDIYDRSFWGDRYLQGYLLYEDWSKIIGMVVATDNAGGAIYSEDQLMKNVKPASTDATSIINSSKEVQSAVSKYHYAAIYRLIAAINLYRLGYANESKEFLQKAILNVEGHTE